MDNSQDITFPDMDSWKGGGNKYGLTFKQIIIQHINRCVMNGSEEWRGGYWEEKVASHGNIIRKYNPDTREQYNNSIKMLRAILLGYYDDDMKNIDADLMVRLKKYEGKMKDAETHIQKVMLHLELFEQLVLLCKRFNFFEEEEVIDSWGD